MWGLVFAGFVWVWVGGCWAAGATYCSEPGSVRRDGEVRLRIEADAARLMIRWNRNWTRRVNDGR